VHLTPELSSGPCRILGFTEFPFHHVSAITVHCLLLSCQMHFHGQKCFIGLVAYLSGKLRGFRFWQVMSFGWAVPRNGNRYRHRLSADTSDSAYFCLPL